LNNYKSLHIRRELAANHGKPLEAISISSFTSKTSTTLKSDIASSNIMANGGHYNHLLPKISSPDREVIEMSPVSTDWPDLTASNLHFQERTLDCNRLATYCPLDNGRHLNTAPSADLGALNILPQELLVLVLRELDLQTLTNFRRVNRQAMISVDAVPTYAILVRHAPNTIRDMLSLGSARFNTCLDLYEKLCTEECDIC